MCLMSFVLRHFISAPKFTNCLAFWPEACLQLLALVLFQKLNHNPCFRMEQHNISPVLPLSNLSACQLVWLLFPTPYITNPLMFALSHQCRQSFELIIFATIWWFYNGCTLRHFLPLSLSDTSRYMAVIKNITSFKRFLKMARTNADFSIMCI